MTIPSLLVALYPPAVRHRWGDELARTVAECGPRSWPDTVRGAVRLWLHPGDWPETITGQTRRVLAVGLFAVTAVAALLLRAAEPTTSLTADARHPLTSLWLLPVLTGLALAAPLPRPAVLLRPAVLRGLAATATRTLAVPAAALVSLYGLAHSGVLGQPAGPLRLAFVGYYWLTLAFASLQLCLLISRVVGVPGLITLPGTGRLRASLLLVGAGLALAAVQGLAGALLPTLDATALLLAAGLTVPAAAALTTGLNLRRQPL